MLELLTYLEYALYGMGVLVLVGVVYIVYKIVSFSIEKMI